MENRCGLIKLEDLNIHYNYILIVFLMLKQLLLPCMWFRDWCLQY